MTTTYRTSLKGTLSKSGDYTREKILAALPASAAQLAKQFGIPKSTARYVLGKLLALGVVKLGEKRLVGKNVEFIYVPLTSVIISPAAKRVLKTFTDPQKPAASPIDSRMRAAALENPSTRNIWARPVWTPPKWTPPRGEQPHIPSRGK